jgi:AraC-like DNA-binding protein
LGKEIYPYDEANFLITSVELPMVVQVTDASVEVPYLSLRLKLDLNVARELVEDHNFQQSSNPTAGRGIATGPVTPELLDAFDRLFDLLSTPRDIPILSSLIDQEILYRLLTSEQGVRLRAIALGGSQSNRTAKAIGWLKLNYRKRLRTGELAETVHMGVSTLHHHFRAMTGMSPLQYQKQLRLHAARRLMLTEALDAGSAALQVGYESATQFNREYSRLFGQPPRRDMEALRATAEKQLPTLDQMNRN